MTKMQRRAFLKLSGATTAAGLAPQVFSSPVRRVCVVLDPASGEPVRWAAGKLQAELLKKGVRCDIASTLEQAKGAGFCILVARQGTQLTQSFPQGGTLSNPESIRLSPVAMSGISAIWVAASGPRGSVYGLLELAERVQYQANPMEALHLSETIEEHPANEVRSVARCFCSEVEDKPWYDDEGFWRKYLDALIASRFNRFNFTFGIAYDFPRGVTGDYFHFPYPYLVDVPGYDVRVVRLANEAGEQNLAPFTAAEREKNLQMLRFIAAETAARGLQFQLGLWTHAYQWTDSPHAHHRIEGLTAENHAAYCRDALAMLLKACPQIEGLTLRVHGESGVPEGSYPFWKTLFAAIANCGRKVQIDMHAKGVNQTMIDLATATGMPVTLGAKYSAEHMSLGYNQADIRELEIPNPNRMETGVFNVSNGERRFTRYGYADFLQQGTPYQLLFRLWPGTQRHLLSSDPEMAAAYGRSASFCGATGLDIFEPLSFKGREGTGRPGGRCAYLDTSLTPSDGDWQKFEYFYLVWGRCLYNPNADPEIWRRYLKSHFGAGALPVETALAHASRVLALMTSAHLPSAANHAYWPEIYDNMPIVEGSERSPYSDTPSPKCFGTVSPLDPQLFSTIVEHVGDLLADRQNPKYSPIEVATWLEEFTAASAKALSNARLKATSHQSPEFRRIEEDVLIQIALGHFFSAKLRSGVLFEIYLQTGNADAAKHALAQYRQARDVWAAMAARADKVYVADITYGETPMRRGNWSARLAAIDRDVAAIESKPTMPAANPGAADKAVLAAAGRPARPADNCSHTPPAAFHPGQPLALSLSVTGGTLPDSVRLYYRHVDQAERWVTVAMQPSQDGFSASVPGEYTNSAFALQYYFALARKAETTWLHPGFNSTLSNQPYYAIAKRV
jgi:hypothetical protein